MGIPFAPKPLLELETAGGAYVRRRFMFGTEEKLAGDRLTADELRSVPRANLVALVNTGRLELWPAAPADMYIAERFSIHVGFGKYEVVEGRKLTQQPVTKEEAEALLR